MSQLLYDLNKTICGIATPTGGGICIIRISGNSSLNKVKKICSFLPMKPISHHVYFGCCKSLYSKETIDQVLVTYFKKNRSFTGEETLEISFHGSSVIAQELMEELILCGCDAAQRGEFTYRAFMNGKINLPQAESILDLVQSNSKMAKKLALKQLCGQVSEHFKEIEDAILFLLSQIEANIDFSEENLELISYEEIKKGIQKIIHSVHIFLSQNQTSYQIKHGLCVSLIGQPNVGKSSLFNALCKEDKAIVSPELGTTRDVVEKNVDEFGLPIRLMDTAGLSNSSSSNIEKMSMDKTHKVKEKSDMIFFLFDLEKGFSLLDEDLLKGVDKEKLYILGNKMDKVSSSSFKKQYESLCKKDLIKDKRRIVFISVQDKKNLENIKLFIEDKIRPILDGDIPEMSQSRHFRLILKCSENLKNSYKILEKKKSLNLDLLAFELKEALVAIQEVLGKKFDDDVLDHIFSQFCIGK